MPWESDAGPRWGVSLLGAAPSSCSVVRSGYVRMGWSGPPFGAKARSLLRADAPVLDIAEQLAGLVLPLHAPLARAPHASHGTSTSGRSLGQADLDQQQRRGRPSHPHSLGGANRRPSGPERRNPNPPEQASRGPSLRVDTAPVPDTERGTPTLGGGPLPRGPVLDTRPGDEAAPAANHGGGRRGLPPTLLGWADEPREPLGLYWLMSGSGVCVTQEGIRPAGTGRVPSIRRPVAAPPRSG